MTMPFGLKNAGATYQWCMQACLKEQIGRNIEVYIDDIVIKSTKVDSLLDDLRETFASLRQQVMKECDATCANMIAYRAMYDKLEGNFEGCEVTYIGRESNEEADNLANMGSKCLPIPPRVFFEEIFERSVKIKPVIDPALATRSGAKQSGPTPAADLSEETAKVMLVKAVWMKPYLAYLIRGELPEDTIHRRQVMRRSKAFMIINGELYKHSTTGVLQWCIAPEDGIALLRDIHEGTCGHHASSQTLVAKAFRSGFYWLSALHDARNIVQHCEACQRFATKPHAPASELHTIPVAWPFAQWGLDQVGPLPKSSRGSHTYLGESNINFHSDDLQFLLRASKLVAQGADQGKLA
jgi:hypothetical protein